jgi:hypothetical protein
LRTPGKAVLALVIALLMMLPLAGSALAKPILVDDFGWKMDKIQDAIDDAPRAAGEEARDNHGWYVSRLASDFNNMMNAAGLGLEDLNKGHWISMFSRWLKKGDDLSVALKAKAEAKAEKKENRAETGTTNDDDDDDKDGDGKAKAPGQEKKALKTQSSTGTEISDLNKGLAKKAERAVDKP